MLKLKPNFNLMWKENGIYPAEAAARPDNFLFKMHAQLYRHLLGGNITRIYQRDKAIYVPVMIGIRQ